MKKLFLAAVALAVIAFAPAKEIETATGHEIHLHKHAEAYSVTPAVRVSRPERHTVAAANSTSNTSGKD